MGSETITNQIVILGNNLRFEGMSKLRLSDFVLPFVQELDLSTNFYQALLF